MLYDVCHNIAKIETYEVDGHPKKLLIHRKGATRAFPGQPVIIPGSMGTGSFVLVGREESMAECFGSSCHGAGRRMSRRQAKREVNGRDLIEALKKREIYINAGSYSGVAEEAPQAYKSVDEVVSVVDQAEIARRVARLRPVAVVKG